MAPGMEELMPEMTFEGLSATTERNHATLYEALVGLERHAPGFITGYVAGLRGCIEDGIGSGPERLMMHAALVGVETTLQLAAESTQVG